MEFRIKFFFWMVVFLFFLFIDLFWDVFLILVGIVYVLDWKEEK